MLIAEELTYSIIGGAHEVYNNLGFGLLEHVYIKALERELRSRGHMVAREVNVMIMYKGEELTTQRMDMLVDNQIIVEAKAGLHLPAASSRQLYSYLRSSRVEVGLLFHFGLERVNHFRVVCSNASTSELRTPRGPSLPKGGTRIEADSTDGRG